MRLRVFGNRTIGRKQGQLGVAERPFIKDFDRTTPIPLLAVVDLAEVQHLALHHSAASTALALDNIPIAMFFAVLQASVELQEHGPIKLRGTKPMKRDLVYTTGELPTRPFDATCYVMPSPHQNRCRRPRVEKVGLIRIGPPQGSASVLSPRGFRRLCFSLAIRALVPAGRVGDWRAGVGRSLCSLLSRPFVCECHTISTMPRFQSPPPRTQRADFPLYALLFASRHGLWGLSCRSDFQRRVPYPIAIEQLQGFVQPPPTPPLPAEALSFPSPHHLAPNLLFHPVFDEAEALAGISDRKVVHPTSQHRVDNLHYPIDWL